MRSMSSSTRLSCSKRRRRRGEQQSSRCVAVHGWQAPPQCGDTGLPGHVAGYERVRAWCLCSKGSHTAVQQRQRMLPMWRLLVCLPS
jgi:ribosomal protein L32